MEAAEHLRYDARRFGKKHRRRDALNERKQCMRKRYQQGSVTTSTDGRYWVGKYRADGKHKTKLLGKCRGIGKISKAQAQEKFAEILQPVSNAGVETTSTI